MTLTQRVDALEAIFYELESTNSRLEKEAIVAAVPAELQEDLQYIFEVLAGVYKFGYTYDTTFTKEVNTDIYEAYTVKQMLEMLQEPVKNYYLGTSNIIKYVSRTVPWASFFKKIVNRDLKLGIGKSLIPKTLTSPMLAKKYSGFVKPAKHYYITEKLDGNRCVSYWDGTDWQFVSRNGKKMHVKFDMTGLAKDKIYDGEVLSPEQALCSHKVYMNVRFGDPAFIAQNTFNKTSGLINTHNENKDLIYNIFDVVDTSADYIDRRAYIDSIDQSTLSKDIRILPVLKKYDSADMLNEDIGLLLDKVTSMGSEGLMINLSDSSYIRSRTDQLLKYKAVKTIDMKVIDICDGTGKYEFMVGSLVCKAVTEDGKVITANVGSGLSDEQRISWMLHPNDILDKIVEVAFFEMCQDRFNTGTNNYSLRFPRLKSVRSDKNETSEF